ncbi:MAG: tRNA (guanosine(37)-N1)-methyltransferase TrmD [Candidatus Eisenbacteria bacterium]|nr:tRNA (guanosine(37)-N1)-methyltransferase TrmD [Candidatus Eisenbacteria bacterium]
MRLTIVTIFPDYFAGALADGMIRVALDKAKLQVDVVNLRDFTDDPHRTVDDSPFGGGAGMVLKVEPIDRALASVGVGEKGARPAGARVLLTSPQGKRFTQRTAIEWAILDHVVIVCGRYKGVDERVSEHFIDEEFSIGDFVLSGGEPAALVVMDALARLQPDVVGKFDSVESDSFHSGLLDCAYWTRPADYKGWPVPEVLTSGHHAKIERARREQALERTFDRRPDLLEHADLDGDDRKFLGALKRRREAGQ